MSLGSRGRKGSTGTSMNMVRRTYRPAGPQLRLPKQPKRADFFTRKQINAEADRLMSERKFKAADEMRKTLSWEQAQDNWKAACEAAKKAHAEKVEKWKQSQAVRKERKAEKARRWQEVIDYCAANGLASPREY